jgi:hypothetical protein
MDNIDDFQKAIVCSHVSSTHVRFDVGVQAVDELGKRLPDGNELERQPVHRLAQVHLVVLHVDHGRPGHRRRLFAQRLQLQRTPHSLQTLVKKRNQKERKKEGKNNQKREISVKNQINLSSKQ